MTSPDRKPSQPSPVQQEEEQKIPARFINVSYVIKPLGDGGFGASCPEIHMGTYGKTIEEASKNLIQGCAVKMALLREDGEEKDFLQRMNLTPQTMEISPKTVIQNADEKGKYRLFIDDPREASPREIEATVANLS